MQLQKSLKLIHYEHATHRNPRLHRRHKLLAKLDKQIQLTQDTSNHSTKTQFVAESDGNIQHVQRAKRVSR